MTALVRFCVRNPFITLALTDAAGRRLRGCVRAFDAQDRRRDPGHLREPDDRPDRVARPVPPGRGGPDHLSRSPPSSPGVKGVKEVRGLSGFGFSQIYVVFEEEIRFFSKGQVADFYEARTRVLEKLASVGKDLPGGRRAGARPGRHRARAGLLVHGGRTATTWRTLRSGAGLRGALRAADRPRRGRGGERRRDGARVPGGRGPAPPASLRRRDRGRDR